MANPGPFFLPALLAPVLCGCSPMDPPQTKLPASGTAVVMVCLAGNWVTWPHHRYQHWKYLLVWQVRGDWRKQLGLCCGWILGKGSPEGKAKRPSHGSNESNSPTDTVEGNQFEDILKYKDRSFQVQD